MSAAQKLLTQLTEKFMLKVGMFMHALCRVWSELLDVLGLDIFSLPQHFNPASVGSS